MMAHPSWSAVPGRPRGRRGLLGSRSTDDGMTESWIFVNARGHCLLETDGLVTGG